MSISYPKVGDELYLQQDHSFGYIGDVKTPYTVIAVKPRKVFVQSCECLWPVYHTVGNPMLDRPDLEGQRVQFYDTLPEKIFPDPNGTILELHWSPKNQTWQIDKYKTGHPQCAHFGKYEYWPYLD